MAGTVAPVRNDEEIHDSRTSPLLNLQRKFMFEK